MPANRDKTHCPLGHPYGGDNLIVRRKNGGRACRACKRMHDSERPRRGLPPGPQRATVGEYAARFWGRVDKCNGPLSAHDGTRCWIWTRGGTKGRERGSSAYGAFWLFTKSYRAHVVAWYLTHNAFSKPGFEICHHCDNRLCVRPDHLFEGTRKDNMLDCARKDRPAYGVRSRQAKLDDVAVREIRHLGKTESSKSIARRFGISRGHIRMILRYKCWVRAGGPRLAADRIAAGVGE